MAEIVTLTTPLTKPTTTTFALDYFTINATNKSLYFAWTSNTGEALSASYPTPAPAGSSQPSGATLLTTLNKMNFSAGNPSLINRIFTRLQADGYITAGAISGTPD